MTTTFIVPNVGQLAESRMVSARDRLLRALHPAVQAKVECLELQANELWHALRAGTEANVEAQQRLRQATADHEDAISTERRTLNRPTEPGPRIVQAAAALTQARERAGLRRTALDRLEQSHASTAAVLESVNQLLATAAPADLVPVIRPLVSSTDIPAKLARIRIVVADLRREQQAIAAAPVPRAEAHARLEAWLTLHAEAYDPPVRSFATFDYRPPAPADAVPYRLVQLLASLPDFCELQHQRLDDAYERMPPSVPSGERPGLVADLAERRSQLEREEEALVLSAERRKLHVDRRADADALVVVTTLLDVKED